MIRARVLLLLPLLVACVSTGRYEAEVSRVRSLEWERDQVAERTRALEQRLADLQKTSERLELERSSLDSERLMLIADLEDLREGNERIRETLEAERATRREREAELGEVQTTYRSLVDKLESELRAGEIEIQELRGQLQVRALDRILFDSGRAEIKTAGERVLGAVATQIRDLNGYTIRVEGHTDDRPISTALFPSNWELSSARAARVVRFLVENGVDANILSAVGYGPFKPVASNDSAKNRALNRRIEIVLVPDARG